MIWSSDVVGRGVQRTLQEGCGECLFLKNIKVNFRGGGRRQSFVNKKYKKISAFVGHYATGKMTTLPS